MVKKIYHKISSWFIIKPKTSGIITFLTILALVFFVVSLRYKIIKENEHREMSNVLEVVHQNIEQVLKNSNTITITLAMTINDNGEPKDFNKIGSKLVTKDNAVDAVQLVPNGVIKYIYPLKGNEAAMNYDILNSKDVRQEANKSIKSKSIYFAGPLELKQGGTAVIGRLPIFKNNTFWGFSAVIIKLETLIKSSGIQAIDKSKYYFQLSKENPLTREEEFFFENKSDFSKNYFQSISIPDGNWKLYIISANKNSIFKQLYTSSILGFLLAVMFGIWVYTILKKPAELQKLILKQAQKLIDNEVEFKVLFDQAPIGIAKLATDTGKFIEVNKEY
jgi:sensor domain CHASE-containing protein